MLLVISNLNVWHLNKHFIICAFCHIDAPAAFLLVLLLIGNDEGDDALFPLIKLPPALIVIIIIKRSVHTEQKDISWTKSVWPDLAKFRQFRIFFEIFGNIWKVYLIFGKAVNPLWDFLQKAIWAKFHRCKWPNIEKQSCHLVTLNKMNSLCWN